MVSCPACLHEFDLEQARNDNDWRDLVHIIMHLPESIHRPLWQYLGLFQGKQQIRSIKMVRIVKEIAPMINSARLQRNKVEYVVTAQQFAQAMSYLVDARPESLVLPLKSNGYLLGMLANQAEQTLAKAEQKREEHLRNRPRESESVRCKIIQAGSALNDTLIVPHETSKPVQDVKTKQTPETFKALAKILRAPRSTARNTAEREPPVNQTDIETERNED